MNKRNLRYAFAFLMICLSFGMVNAGSGGPDAYGYVWRDSDELNGPTYNWIDITTMGTRVTGLSDDNSVGPVQIGFNFHYYWSDYNQVKIGSNGWIGFKTTIGNIAHCFPVIPTQGGAGDDFLAPFMTDLNFTSSYTNFPNPGEMYYWSNNVDTFIITWVNVPWWKNDNGGANPPDWDGSNTFQLILSAVDSSITFQYNDMDPNAFSDTQGCTSEIEIGMENITGNIGLESYVETVPNDQFAIKYYYPANTTFVVPDATPAWNANADNAGQFFLTGTSVDMLTNIANVGNSTITNVITVPGELVKLDLTTVVWSDQFTLDSLQSGASQTVTFPSQATLIDVGQYYYNVETNTANNGDINPSNNENTVEVSAVENNNGVISLSYATQNPPDGLIAWGSSGSGAAIKVVPPGYPAIVRSVDVFILGPDNDPQTPMPNGFDIQIWSEDANGDPGTLVTSETITAANVLEDQWNNIPISQPFTVTTGGFFVAWIHNGDSVFLGTESLGPISRRTYEILAGNWSPYRLGTSEDFLMNVNVDGDSLMVGLAPAQTKPLSLTAYPNPANDQVIVNVDLPGTGEVEISLIDIYGKVVLQQSKPMVAGPQDIVWNTSAMAAGVYFVRLRSQGEQLTQKLIINH